METIAQIVGYIFMAIVFVIVLSLIAAFPLMLLWNWLCPDLFNLPMLTFWQAWGLMVLCGLMFKNNSMSKSKD